MKRDTAAALFHVALVIAVYAIYGAYPPYAVPVPYFDSFGYMAGMIYGVAGLLTLNTYVRKAHAGDTVQSLFNRAVLLIVAGGLLFLSESIGNAG